MNIFEYFICPKPIKIDERYFYGFLVDTKKYVKAALTPYKL